LTQSCSLKKSIPSIDRPILHPICKSSNQPTIMPTRDQQELARARGAAADALMEQFYLGQQQQQQQQAENPSPSSPLPPHPSQATQGTADLFAAAFGGENQAPAAVQRPPAVDGRTGQHASPLVAADGPPAQRVITDSHAQVVRPNPVMMAGQRRSRRSRSRTRQRTTATPITTATDFDPADIPQDVLDEIARDEAAQAPVLMEDEAIEQDIRHIMRSRVADRSCRNYNDYMVRLIIFLYDNKLKFSDLICPHLLTELDRASQQDAANLTRAGLPKKKRIYIRAAILQCLEGIVTGDETTFPLFLEKLDFLTLAHFLNTFSKQYTRKTDASGNETV
jgi:hypothetical protein